MSTEIKGEVLSPLAIAANDEIKKVSEENNVRFFTNVLLGTNPGRKTVQIDSSMGLAQEGVII